MIGEVFHLYDHFALVILVGETHARSSRLYTARATRDTAKSVEIAREKYELHEEGIRRQKCRAYREESPLPRCAIDRVGLANQRRSLRLADRQPS